jgi:hypothetical protein
MARGGARPGAGRPKGSGLKRKRQNLERLERRAEKSIGAAVQRLKRVRAKIFDGDAHAFLVGDPKTLLWKARAFLDHLPPEFLGGWNRGKHAPYIRIFFPESGSVIFGEGEN